MAEGVSAVDGSPLLTVVGAINLDLTARVERMPVAGETVADGTLTRGCGGKGANQAIAAARLGGAVRLVGCVGDDADGRFMLDNLRSAGVDIASVQVALGASGTALITVDAEGENSIVVCPGANAALDGTVASVGPDDAVLAQLEVPAAAVERIVERTEGFVAINASPAGALSAALRRRADLIIVNESEYAALDDPAGAPLVALTLGAEGAVLLCAGDEIARSRATARTIVNTVGAGDSFAAALTLGILRGDDPREALARACAVGAAAVADPASQPELSVLSSYPVS